MNKKYIIISVLFFLFFVITSALLFIGKPEDAINTEKITNELFYPELKKLNSINKTIVYADSIYSTLKLKGLDTAIYVEILSGILKKRFHHGLSNYTSSENWIAHYSGKIFWSHFSVIVDAEDILKHPGGLCSQQNIVFIKALNKKGISTRTVGLGNSEGPGHFAIEVKYNNNWHLYDIDLEPNWSKINSEHMNMDYLLAHKDELFDIYNTRLDKSLLEKMIVKVSYGTPNNSPAKNMLLFHKCTKIATYILPFIFLLLSLFFIKKSKS